jgi:dUTP pyrophosphatase
VARHYLRHSIEEDLMMQYYKLHSEAVPPTRAYDYAVGYDLHALILTAEGNPSTRYIPPHASSMISTGLALVPPPGHFLSICSRSGLAAHDPPIFVANAPGIIDPDYTGEIKVILANIGLNTYPVRHQERIAQLVVLPLHIPELQELAALPEAYEKMRGDKGFGSTG